MRSALRQAGYPCSRSSLTQHGNAVSSPARARSQKARSEFFTIGTKAKNDHISYDGKKGYLFYDADGSGKGAAVLFAKLGKNLKISEKDFYVI
jgi:hypothetical protein